MLWLLGSVHAGVSIDADEMHWAGCEGPLRQTPRRTGAATAAKAPIKISYVAFKVQAGVHFVPLVHIQASKGPAPSASQWHGLVVSRPPARGGSNKCSSAERLGKVSGEPWPSRHHPV